MGRDETIYEGKTLDDAVRKGLQALGLSRAEVMITVVEEGSGGFLGLGARAYRVRVVPRPGGAIREPDSRRSGRSNHREPRRDRDSRGREPRGRGERSERPGDRGDRRDDRGDHRRRSERGPGEPARAEGRQGPRPGRDAAGGRPRAAAQVASGPGSADEDRRRRRRRGGRGRGGVGAPADTPGPRPDNHEESRPRSAEPREGVATMSPADLEREAVRLTEELLTQMGYAATVTGKVEDTRVDVHAVVPAGEDELAGRKGEVRQALQHLLNRMLNRGGGSLYHLQLEVNDFWERRETELEDLARRLAEEALARNGEAVSEYLNAQERRVVHVALKGDTRVKTYALGTGLIKRVAVAPADFPEPAPTGE